MQSLLGVVVRQDNWKGTDEKEVTPILVSCVGNMNDRFDVTVTELVARDKPTSTLNVHTTVR